MIEENLNKDSIDPEFKKQKEPKENLKELILIILISSIPGLIFPFMRTFSLFLPLIFYFVDKNKYGRTWEEIGFKKSKFIKEFKKFWPWILLVGLIFQISFVLITIFFAPELYLHVLSRIPFISSSGDIISIIFIYFAMIFTTLGEEIVYRAYFQDRLSKHIGNMNAIILISLLFAVIHWSTGTIWIIMFDMGFIFIDSIIFGFLYLKSHDVRLCWMAHFIANVFSLSLLLILNLNYV
jgi:membrane protease YdiL (CAAX protease family)